MGPRRPIYALGALLVAYSIIGVQYALRVPLWEAPDEPAHYNYVAQVATGAHRPPVIEPGDYPHAYLEQLKAQRFPADLPVTGIGYEDHQPPLYYYLASAVFARAGPGTPARVHAVRLLGVVLGAILVALAWWFAWRGWEDEWLALACAGFVAFLPMQLAVTGAVNNDALANVLAALALCIALERAAGRLRAGPYALWAGVLVGLSLVTKVTIYAPVVATILAGEVLSARQCPDRRRLRSVLTVAAALAIAAVVATPWFARNVVTYGWRDPLGLAAHDAVVIGQPRTADWIAAYGVAGLLARMARFTFDSFWGVFGWMGVFMDQRVYELLALATLLAAGGIALWIRRSGSDRRERRTPRPAVLALSALACASVMANFGWYNLTFVQHQGRYFFAALVPIAFLFCLGLAEWGHAADALVARRPSVAGRAIGRLAPGAVPLAFVLALGALALYGLYGAILPELLVR